MPTKPPAVLLVSENEKSAQLDRRSLREAGYTEIAVMTSGIAAARMLAGLDAETGGFVPGIVVCAHKLDDMDGEQFCAIVREHPLLLGLPILLITPNESEAEQLRTLGCGASDLLGRPYSVESLKKHMDALATAAVSRHKLQSAAKDVDTAAFDTALATYGILLRPARQPEDYFNVGMRCLREKRWNYAISAFEHALRNAQIKAEAELGIAAAFRGKGDMERFKAWLARAAQTFVLARRWHQARTAYARLLRHDPAAKNPFLAEAHRLIRENAYMEAANVLVQSLSVIPKGQTGDRFAQVCMASADPEAMFKALERTLNREDAYLGNEIRQRLEVLARAKDERARQQAAERKWELSRKMAAQKKVTTPPPAPEPEAPAIADFGEEVHEDAAVTGEALPEPQNMFFPEDEAEDIPVLAPLTRTEATSDLFARQPKLNEFLSVVKLTWRLARRSRKKGE